MRKYKNSISLDEVMENYLNSQETIKDFLNATLESYLEDGDFNSFYRSLEYVIKAQDTISGFSKKANITRQALYDIFNGKKEPKIQTIAKILNALGYKLNVA